MGDSGGLFSRAGRSNTQRFGAIKKVERLLTGRPEVPSPRAIPLLRKSTQEELLTLANQPLQDSDDRLGASFAFLVQSREKFYASRRPKVVGPPPGAYSVSYTQVDKHKGWAHTRSSKVSVLFSPPESPSGRYLGVDTPAKRLNSTVSFRKQVARLKHWIGQTSAHELRFTHSNLMPANASKFRKSPNVHFGLSSPRSSKLFPGPKAAPDHYSPQVSTVLPRSPSFLFPKDATPRFQTLEGSQRQYQVSFDPVTPRVRTVVDWSLEKQPKSELGAQLPRYMLATTSRLAIQEVSEKTLRLRGSPVLAN